MRRLPDEVFGLPKAELQQVPLNLLRINEPGDYKLDKGDVLAVVADEILTRENQPVPVQFLPVRRLQPELHLVGDVLEHVLPDPDDVVVRPGRPDRAPGAGERQEGEDLHARGSPWR